MTNGEKLTREEVIALRGIRLPAVALKQLRAAGIYCEPSVSIERQCASKQFVLRGVESGGCAAGLGLYCSFVTPGGGFLPWLQRAQAVGVNGVHAVVVAPTLARVQMFYADGACELLITLHELEHQQGSSPQLRNRILFHVRNGALDREANTLPEFMTRAGDLQPIPEQFREAVFRTAKGLLCCPCRHVHVLTRPAPSTNAASLEADALLSK